MARTGRFQKLKDLGQEVMDEIDNRLQDGQPAREIVAYIQGELNLLPDENPDSLKKMLERYRGTDFKEKVIMQVTEATKGMAITTVAKNLNALTELATLTEIQKARFMKLLTTEQKNEQFVLKQTSEEGKLLKEMLVELGKLQLETGVLKRAPKTISGQMTDAEGNTTEFTWSEEQDQLYKTIEHVGDAEIQLPIG